MLTVGEPLKWLPTRCDASTQPMATALPPTPGIVSSLVPLWNRPTLLGLELAATVPSIDRASRVEALACADFAYQVVMPPQSRTPTPPPACAHGVPRATSNPNAH